MIMNATTMWKSEFGKNERNKPKPIIQNGLQGPVHATCRLGLFQLSLEIIIVINKNWYKFQYIQGKFIFWPHKMYQEDTNMEGAGAGDGGEGRKDWKDEREETEQSNAIGQYSC